MINGSPLFSPWLLFVLSSSWTRDWTFLILIFIAQFFLINYYFREIDNCDMKSVCGRIEGTGTGRTRYKLSRECLPASIYYTSIACCLFALESLIKEPVEMLESFYIIHCAMLGNEQSEIKHERRERLKPASSRQIGNRHCLDITYTMNAIIIVFSVDFNCMIINHTWMYVVCFNF